MLSTQQKFSIGYLILTLLGLVLLQTVFFAPQSENLSYRDFKTLLKAGKVVDLTLKERTMSGRLTTDGLEGLLPGAQDDLQRATDLVRHMITRYGMSEALGLATFEAPRTALFLQVPTGAPREYSEDTARLIDMEIQQLLEAAHARVRTTLTAKRALLESLGALLIAHEVVDRDALTQLLGTVGCEEAPQVPMSADPTAETVGVVTSRVTPASNGEHTTA